jgi:hypothetical protein
MYLNQVSQQAHAAQQQQQQQQQQRQQLDPYAVAQLQQQQEQVLAAQQAALYGNSPAPTIDALDIPPNSQSTGHQQSASISDINGFQSGTSGAQMIGGLLAPARSHNRAVSLPAFAPQANGFQDQNGNTGNADEQRGRGHQYQSSFSGGLSVGNGVQYSNGNGAPNGYSLAVPDAGMGNRNGLNGWAEEEVVTN